MLVLFFVNFFVVHNLGGICCGTFKIYFNLLGRNVFIILFELLDMFANDIDDDVENKVSDLIYDARREHSEENPYITKVKEVWDS